MACANIPDEYADERGWCRDLQALKAFVWIEWVTSSFSPSNIVEALDLRKFSPRYGIAHNSLRYA